MIDEKKQCQCKKGYHQHGSKCLGTCIVHESAPVEDQCDCNGENCRGFEYCYDGKCHSGPRQISQFRWEIVENCRCDDKTILDTIKRKDAESEMLLINKCQQECKEMGDKCETVRIPQHKKACALKPFCQFRKQKGNTSRCWRKIFQEDDYVSEAVSHVTNAENSINWLALAAVSSAAFAIGYFGSMKMQNKKPDETHFLIEME